MDVFRTTNLTTSRQGSSGAAYGGLIFAQALAAAENTVNETLKPHAMHSFFLLNVDTALPVQYHVRRVRDGRSYSTRTVEAIQEGKIVFILQVEPDAAIHQEEMPNVTSWKELKCLTEVLSWLRTEIAENRIVVKPSVERYIRRFERRTDEKIRDLFEIRPCNIDQYIGVGEMSTSRTFYSWFKALGCLGDCEKLNRYLVAYNTDATMAGSAFRPHFVNDFQPSMILSLDHNVWMHQHLMRADQWMLFENTSTVAGRGRAFTTGKLWNEDGTLVLSCTQEIVLRSRGIVSSI
ncbi:putative acyl-CoA thioesterase II [Dictyocaulus viviparus]|uniref:Putative acyl-CoA thioesterase II n=1 Tax=Dictyocaulus viviparus TaxID=29172 RepID=A0A0D8XT27_DICVI|nr:putative acyl-CoA thioesterase II [Dictyocaulus viviparus]